MRRSYAVIVVLLLSIVHMVAAQPLRIDRPDPHAPMSQPTAASAIKPTTSVTAEPIDTIERSRSVAPLPLRATTELSATTALSTTGLLTSTDAISDSSAFTAMVIGYVRLVDDKTPIAGADVVVGGVQITTREDGTFGPVDIPLNEASEDVDASAVAPGFTRWAFNGVPLHDQKKLDIHIELRREGTRAPAPAPARPLPSVLGAPPERIRLGITGSSDCVFPTRGEVRVVEMPFTDYLRNVLPNEWFATWPGASLDAGAIAAKQFAWYTAFVERKWSSQGFNFDLLDSTCDQHYKANSYKPATDAALQRTWHMSLTRNGQLFPTYYRAEDDQCMRSRSDDCMGQWGSKRLADRGMSGINILLSYYKRVNVEGLPRQNPVFLPLVIDN